LHSLKYATQLKNRDIVFILKKTVELNSRFVDFDIAVNLAEEIVYSVSVRLGVTDL